MPNGDDGRYDAFISYSHQRDRHLAIAMQTGLQRFAKPWYRRRALRIFRDESSLSATPGLWPTVERALAASEYFVLVASPESRESVWVAREVGYWLELGRRDRLLVALSAGGLIWAGDDFDWSRTDALTPVLRGVFAQEPLHVDLRWARAQNAVAARDARLVEPLASLAAPMHGRPRDALIGDDLRQHRRTVRTAWSAVATLVVLLVAAVLASVVAVDARNRAEREARVAMARLLGIESGSVGADSRDVGLLLAAQAYVAAPDTASSWGPLVRALAENRALIGYLPDSAGATTVTAAPAEDLLAVGDEGGSVTLWRAADRTRLRVLAPALSGAVTTVGFSGDGRRLIAGDDTGGYAVWETAGGARIAAATAPSPLQIVALDGPGDRFAAGTADNRVVFGRPGEPGVPLAEKIYQPRRLVFGPDTLTSVEAQGEMATWRLPTGEKATSTYVGLGQPVASAVSPGLGYFAGVTLGNPPYVVDVRAKRDITLDLRVAGLSVKAMEFDATGAVLIIATSGGELIFWDVRANRSIGRLVGTPGEPRGVAIQDVGRVTAVVGERGVGIWNVAADLAFVQPIAPRGSTPLTDVPNVVRGSASVTFSPDGRSVAWTTWDGNEVVGVVWDLRSRRERARLPGGRLLSFSPDGERIATRGFSAPADGPVTVTDLGSGRSEEHAAVPWDAVEPPRAPSPRPWTVDNGRGLGVATPTDGVLALWDTERSQLITEIDLDLDATFTALAFDARGGQLAVAVPGGALFLLDVDPDSWRRSACSLAGRSLTDAEHTAYIGAMELPAGCPS
jgi:WD40 repeat protein